MARRIVPFALSIALAMATPAAGAHPEATLKAARSSVTAGATLPVTGEKFDASQTVRLMLRGALGDYPLTDVTADTAGAFALDLEIPAEVRAGRYQLVALADDGDVAARLELTAEAPAPPGAPATGMEEMAQGAMTADHDMMAMAAELPIERSFSGAGWGIIGLLVGLAGGLGLGLLRRPA